MATHVLKRYILVALLHALEYHSPVATLISDESAKPVLRLYFLLLFLHIAHVLEELWGGFVAIAIIGSQGRFLFINLVLFGVVLTFFYAFLIGKRWANYASILYAAIMTVNGIGHIVATLAAGKYFSGYAGAYSGIGLVLVGPLLVLHLLASPGSADKSIQGKSVE